MRRHTQEDPNGTGRQPFDYVHRIWRLRYFWFSLVRNDLNQRYSRSFLGIGWSMVRPLAMTAVFCVVFARLFQISLLEYAPFIFLGLTLWQFLVETIVGGCDCFSRAAPYIRQQRIPLAIFPLRTVLGTGFHALVALAPGSPDCLVVPWLSERPGAAVPCSERHHPVSARLVSGHRRRRVAHAFLRHAPSAGDWPANPVLLDADPVSPGEPGAVPASCTGWWSGIPSRRYSKCFAVPILYGRVASLGALSSQPRR